MNKSLRLVVVIALLVVAAVALLYWVRGRAPQEPVPGPVSGNLLVRFLDIGQGDSQLLQLPGGETILIDSGDRGAPTLDHLKKYGVRQIDLMIATHPHADHIGEMRDVMRAFTVKEFWDSGFAYSSKTYEDMLREIATRGIAFSAPKRGASRKFGDVLVEVLHPAETPPDDEANNASMVVRVTFGGNRLLFTGDAEERAWKEMLDGDRQKLRADLLKSAHHGSFNGTTEEVLDAVRPSIYTISCAVGNSYHHPHPSVVQMLKRQSGIKVYRTDLQGTITANCDGQRIQMTTEKQVAQDQLYLTGDEVAGKVAGDGRGQSNSSRGNRKAK